MEDVEALNRDLLERVQQDSAIYLTSTVLNGEYVLRANIVNFRMQEADLDLLIECIESAGQAVTESGS